MSGFLAHWPKMIVLVALGSLATLVACTEATYKASEPQAAPRSQVPQQRPADADGGGDATVPCNQPSGNICRGNVDWTKIQSLPINFTTDWPIPEVGTLTQEIAGVNCFYNRYSNIIRNFDARAVDLWLVVDASKSFDRERVEVGQAIVQGFVDATRMGVPVNVSVIAAHSPDSPDSTLLSSSVFYRHGSEPATVVLQPGMSASALNQATNDLLAKLDSNMRMDPWRRIHASGLHSGADEMGLLALSNAMKRVPSNPENALTIMFLSDENDVCMGPQFNDSHDPDENQMYNQYCDGVTPTSIYQQIRNYAGDRPTIVTSVVYSGTVAIPAEANNTVGRGYMDVTSLAGGKLFELPPVGASSDYLRQMAIEASHVTAGMTGRYARTYPHYPVYNLNGQPIDLSSIRVLSSGVLDMKVVATINGVREWVGYQSDPVYNLVTPDNVGEGIEIRYCLK